MAASCNSPWNHNNRRPSAAPAAPISELRAAGVQNVAGINFLTPSNALQRWPELQSATDSEEVRVRLRALQERVRVVEEFRSL